MEKKTVFSIALNDIDGYDFLFILHTAEEKTVSDIESIVDYYTEVCDRNLEDFSPVDVMDSVVDAYDGWWWEDFRFDLDLRN